MNNVALPQQVISCKICNSVKGLQRCSKCKTIYYCSQLHQQMDWKRHKLDCSIYTTTNNIDTINTVKSKIRNKQQLFPENGIKNNNINDINAFPKQGTSESDILGVSAEKISPLPTILHTNASYNNTTKNDENETTNEKYFRNLSENTMRINDEYLLNPNLLSSEICYEDLCKNIIRDMNTYGLSVIDDFLGMSKGLAILNEVHRMYAAGVFKNGQLVSSSVTESDLRTIRGDKITWVKGTEPGCANIGFLINQIDNVVISANRMRNNGTLGNYKIKERTKAMVACYPGSGAHYVMHVDNPNRDGRIITAIYYLNLNWDTKRSGGILRIFPEHGGSVADIEPKFDRIIFFWSDRRNPHEVQPAHRTRYAITVWYFDADERESALNRYRKYQESGT